MYVIAISAVIKVIALRKNFLDWDFVYVGVFWRNWHQPEGFITWSWNEYILKRDSNRRVYSLYTATFGRRGDSDLM